MRYLIVLLLATGCAATQPAQQWNTCVDDKAHIGYRLKHADGRIGTVKEVFGRSDRCSEPGHPILATVEYE